MGAAYGVPLGGAMFSLEVMRGVLALRYVLPALFSSVVATAVSWLFLPDAPTYLIPSYPSSLSVVVWALVAGPIAGVVSVGYVRAITWADRSKARGWRRLIAPVVVLGLLGVVSIWFPQLLGNGKDISQLAFTNQIGPALLLILLALKPIATVLCMSSGALSTVMLMMELTARDRSFIAPMILAVATATLVARTIEPRSIYDARLTDEEIAARQKARELPPR